MDLAASSMAGRLARASLQILLITAALALAAFVLVKLRLVVVPVVVALFLATFLEPPQRALARRGVPGALAAIIVIVAALGLVVLVLTLLVPRVGEEVGQLGVSLRVGIREVTASIQDAFGITDLDLNQAANDLVATLHQSTGAITRGLLSGAILIGEALAGLLLLLVALFFLLKDGPKIWSWFVEQFPEGRTRVDVAELGGRAWRTLTGYIRGIATVATVDSVLIGIGLAVVGVPLVLPLAVLTFVAAFFPLVGAFTAGLVAALVALVAKGWVVALIVVAIITIVQQLEGNIIYPVVVGRAISIHPLAILLAVTAGAIVGGIVGALLAPPIVAVAWTVISYLRRLPAHPTEAPSGAAAGFPAGPEPAL